MLLASKFASDAPYTCLGVELDLDYPAAMSVSSKSGPCQCAVLLLPIPVAVLSNHLISCPL